MKRRTFSDLEKKLTRKKLRMFIREVANFYANSDYGISRPYIANYYHITDSCYYKILEVAIIWNIVDDVVVKRMEEKTSYNATLHSGTANKTHEKYARLREQREEYKRFPFTKKEAISIVVQFTEDRGVTKKILADIYCVTQRDIDKALYVACVNCWIDDALFQKLKDQSLEGISDEKSIQFFEDLEKNRKNLRKLQKENK